MTVLLMAHGSSGDVLPYLWLGKVLQKYGHRVIIITHANFAIDISKAGLEFIPLRMELFDEMMGHPDRLRIWKGTQVAYEFSARISSEFARAVQTWYEYNGPPDLMMASPVLYAAHLMREKLRIPLITVHLVPLSIQSFHSPALLIPQMRWLRLLPLWARRMILSRPNPFEHVARPWVRILCEEHGILMPINLSRSWWDSPDGVLTLFPKWFANPQPDWPRPILPWEFPLEDLSGSESLSKSTLDFLANGDRPVVFTAGTFNLGAEEFFKVAALAVSVVKCRAIFVSNVPWQIPPDLSPDVLVLSYTPFSLLLRQACAFVHHGGIGSLSQALAAGIPQLIIPATNDQPDNADRLEKLRAGMTLPIKSFNPKNLTRTLGRLLTNVQLQKGAAKCAENLRGRLDPTILVQWIEQRKFSLASAP